MQAPHPGPAHRQPADSQGADGQRPHGERAQHQRAHRPGPQGARTRYDSTGPGGANGDGRGEGPGHAGQNDRDGAGRKSCGFSGNRRAGGRPLCRRARREAEALWRSRGITAVHAVVVEGKWLISGGQPAVVLKEVHRSHRRGGHRDHGGGGAGGNPSHFAR